jgi:hypothetical protein
VGKQEPHPATLAFPHALGCPTLATSLFLSLGWETTTLNQPLNRSTTNHGCPISPDGLSVRRCGKPRPPLSHPCDVFVFIARVGHHNPQPNHERNTP